MRRYQFGKMMLQFPSCGVWVCVWCVVWEGGVSVGVWVWVVEVGV